MAEEQLTLVDGMSASLRRIYQEAERLNRRIVTLKTNIKSLEKPMSLSFLRRELKETENQAKLTETALKRAVRVGEKEGVLSWNARYRGIQHLIPYGQKQFIKDADLIRYGQRLEQAPIRRDRMRWANDRILNGLTFDQRLAKLQQKSFSNMLTKPHLFLRGMSKLDKEFGILSNSSSGLTNNFMRVTSALLFFGGVLSSVANVANKVFVEPQSKYMSNFNRVALTNDSSKTPSQMMNDLYDTASRTRAPADATFMLYNRIALSGVKASNERIRRFVESFNKVTAVSGTTGQENRAVMLQLAQGMGSNRLGGDEFRSISEQAPLFKYMLAKGLGVNPGALKEMGAKGKLTAEAILTAMEKVQDQIDLIFKEAPLTIDQTITILQNKWSKLINDQFVGYIALRDLIKDIVIWMDTPKGKEVISTIITGWNNMLFKTVQWIRQLAPYFIWILKHIKLIRNAIFTTIGAILIVKTAINLLKMTVMAFQFYEWFISATAGAVMLRTALSGIGPIILSWLNPLAKVLAAIGLVVGAIMAVKKLKKEFDPQEIAKNQRDKAAFFRFNRDIDKYINQKYPIPTYLSAKGSNIKKTPEQIAAESDMAQKRAAAYQMKDYLIYQYNEAQKKGIYLKFRPEMMDQFSLNGIKGMANSSKNVPMVGKVNEVGKVNDSISIDNDGIEMMKAIAERQWVMQNEVTVPQKVDVKVERTADVDEERIAEAITGGMKIAVASSMRGVMA